LVTGGAGFIVSNVVAGLNEAGRADIAVCDELGSGQKWRNLAKRALADIVPPQALPSWLDQRKLDAARKVLGVKTETETVDAALDAIALRKELSRALRRARAAGGLKDIYKA